MRWPEKIGVFWYEDVDGTDRWGADATYGFSAVHYGMHAEEYAKGKITIRQDSSGDYKIRYTAYASVDPGIGFSEEKNVSQSATRRTKDGVVTLIRRHSKPMTRNRIWIYVIGGTGLK